MSVKRTPTPWESTFQALRADLIRQAVKLTGNRDDAEDVAHDAYLKGLEYTRRGEVIRDPGQWLRRAVRNTATDRLRVRKSTLDLDEVALSGPMQGDDAQSLHGCLAPLARTLPHPYADALMRTDLGDGRMQDLAADHDIGLSAAKSRVQRARSRLAQEIRRCCETVAAPSEPYLRSLGQSPCCPVAGPIASPETDAGECCD
jgi:RNA polymerase sigma-70 factor, ECF subfamily